MQYLEFPDLADIKNMNTFIRGGVSHSVFETCLCLLLLTTESALDLLLVTVLKHHSLFEIYI